MNNRKSFNGLWVVAGLIGLTVVMGTALWLYESKDKSDSSRGVVEKTSEVVTNSAGNEVVKVVTSKKEKLKQKPRIYRKRLEPEATKRLATSPQKVKMVLTTTGRAENAKWGIAGMGSFVLTYYLDCDAEILEKSETPGGEIRVVEKRTFNQCRKVLRVHDTDVRFRLYETLPLTQVFTAMKIAGGIVATFFDPASGGAMMESVEAADGFLRGADGKSAKETLARFGVEVPDDIERQINDFAMRKVESIIKTVDVEGKSYRLTYIQDKESGSPLRVDFTYADGREIQTQEEYLVLRRANAFMDANVVPDKNCKPGDTWTVDTSGFESLLDPYVDGAYCGDVTVARLDNDKDGTWQIGLRPCSVFIKSDEGRTTGEVHLESGEAKVDAENVFVKAMVVTGKGRMKNLSPHHLLFKSRFEGDCEFRGMMTTESIGK